MSISVHQQTTLISVVPVSENQTRTNIDRNNLPSDWRINLAMAGLILAQTLTEAGIFDDTPRIYGAEEHELIILPHYKFRTMSAEMVAKAEQLKAEGNFVKGRDDHRTLLGKFLVKTNLDEIPFYQLIGVLPWFGDVRPLLVQEQDNIEFKEAAAELDMTPMDVCRAISGRVGYFCTQHTLGTRVLEGLQAWRQYVCSATISDENRPSKLARAQAVLHPTIRKQNKSPQI